MVKPSTNNKFFTIFSIFMCCLIISGCNDNSKPSIIIKDAHLYLPLKGTNMAAGYLRLENNLTKKIVISSIECEKVSASIHETTIDSEGSIKMKKIELFSVDSESHVDFMPGAKHIMFSGIKEFKEKILMCNFSSKAGIEIPFTFEVLNNE